LTSFEETVHGKLQNEEGTSQFIPRLMLTRGADGWRGVINESFTVEAVTELAAAIGLELRERFGQKGEVLVSHDARLQSEIAAQSAATVLSSLGFDIILGGILATPLATFAVRSRKYLGALIITASHNPASWNGVKLKVTPGMPPNQELEIAIERQRSKLPSRLGVINKAIKEIDVGSLEDEFISQIIQQVDFDLIRESGLYVAVDGLNGVGSNLLKKILEVAGCQVDVLDKELDPLFNGLVPNPMNSKSRQRLAEHIRLNSVNIGFLTDGDGDRLGVIDNDGAFIQPHNILALLLQRIHHIDQTPGAVAKTVSAGAIVKRVAQALGRPVIETGIGFKYIAPLFQRQEIIMGGGSVGDVGFRRNGYDRDPFLAALMLTEVVAQDGRSLQSIVSELQENFGKSFYHEVTFKVPQVSPNMLKHIGFRALDKIELANSITSIEKIDGVKFLLANNAWVLLRNASTENGIRVYAEASTPEKLAKIHVALKDILKQGDKNE